MTWVLLFERPISREVRLLAKDTLSRVRNNLGTDYVTLSSLVNARGERDGQLRLDLRLQDVHTGEFIGVVSETDTRGELFGPASRAGINPRKEFGIGNISGQPPHGHCSQRGGFPIFRRRACNTPSPHRPCCARSPRKSYCCRSYPCPGTFRPSRGVVPARA
jgi:hypothetical protein